MLGLIWAEAADGVIGAGGAIPWRLPEDQAHFRACTDRATVVMGRRTWESLPAGVRPLPGRRNIVLTSRPLAADGVLVRPDLASALAAAVGDVWVIGGALVYAEALPLADRIERTVVDLAVRGDVRAPVVDGDWTVVGSSPPRGWHESRGGLRYRVVSYARRVPSRDNLGVI